MTVNTKNIDHNGTSKYLKTNKAKYGIVLLFVLLNVGLLLMGQFTRSDYVGTIEALGYSWTTHSAQEKNTIKTQNYFVKVDNSADTESNKLNFEYTFNIIGDNEYIATGENELIPVRHNIIYSLDDTCSLVISGPKSIKISNTSLRCEY